ncbi:MAG: hypothetical protein A3G51_00525 [Candidatus Yanofskybacteria bacterium RIFCSPLOWO2_12_FULL_43_11b]|uniref:Uncharacterized protein n=1 Tax=Candidatus Yanofskybacteria bacterium RIFCSPLOWO2_12_FULL_43_11b TaxID=1802710 RepID=A0A1F8H8M2_9BACT|nr:MAG: hypothetical protein A3G51_00525 [Candidatus Yanofskybacteria bacterium RIFCSPLOWO2_12_FULL_43_11b]
MPSENDPQMLGLGSSKRRGRRKICRWSKSILVRGRHVAFAVFKSSEIPSHLRPKAQAIGRKWVGGSYVLRRG